MQENISYIHGWNFFSKSHILKNNIKSDCSLIIVENNKDLEIYERIFNFLDIKFRTLDTLENLGDLIFNKSWFFIASLEVLENIKINKNQLKHFSLELEKVQSYKLDDITKKLNELSYKFSEFENPWTFKKSWDTIKIISPDSKNKYEISFWGDEIEEIRVNSKVSEKVNIWKNELLSISVDPHSSPLLEGEEIECFLDIISDDIFIILDNLNFSKYYDILTNKLRNFSCFDYIANKNLEIIDLEIDTPKIKNTNELKDILNKKNVSFYTKNTKTIKNFLEYNNIKCEWINEVSLNVLKSFETKEKIVICDDIIREIFTKKRLKKNLSADLDLLLKIKPWDYVVHIEHWIWIFKEIVKKEINGKNKVLVKEYIEIEYLWDDKLFVPITEVSRVNKYLWVENPKLTGLGWVSWENKLKKATKEAEEIASELIEIYANRKLNKWFSFLFDEVLENKFKNSFEYLHTEDQATTINEILEDMHKPIPMDRLIVWDVWFWKTEIAFNAIYRSFLNKKQSILIVPLVVLAYEHFEKSKERFKDFWLKIWILTRLETEKQASNTIKKLASWELDLVVWTHKLLSSKIIYKDLWLIVTDEEHKFWVSDKEKIKEFKTSIDSLAMSATPIPRSLNMALSNIRQISILKTPPAGRQDIDTIINRFSESIIQLAWEAEFDRSGQMFFVHNRVSSIENIKTILQKIFPKRMIVVTHGQLPWAELEKRIIAFKNKKFDILLSTTVIENWIDFSNVNTIIINNAEQFWLSQIHQLRWRVWRSEKKWYCHLLYKWENIKPVTAKRLKTIVEYSYLWAWFELAMKDLEIRWGWDLLGFRQSGQASQVWINLYLKIIEEKIIELQKASFSNSLPNDKKQEWSNENTSVPLESIITKIDLDIEVFIPDDFFGSELDKINFYREIELINDLEELENIKMDFINSNNTIPEPFYNLFDLLELKLRASKYLIEGIKKIWVNYQIDFDKNIGLEELKEFLNKDKEVKFKVITTNKLKASIKNFANTKNFIKYMLCLFKGYNLNTKIKLKWKK
jgi:transcription-repair coupling factor (superfamily II helicase)